MNSPDLLHSPDAVDLVCESEGALPSGHAGEWTDTAFQEKRADGKTAMIPGFAALFSYPLLVGLYESWTIPVPVMLSVSIGVLGLFAAIVVAFAIPPLYVAFRSMRERLRLSCCLQVKSEPTFAEVQPSGTVRAIEARKPTAVE